MEEVDLQAGNMKKREILKTMIVHLEGEGMGCGGQLRIGNLSIGIVQCAHNTELYYTTNTKYILF